MEQWRLDMHRNNTIILVDYNIVTCMLDSSRVNILAPKFVNLTCSGSNHKESFFAIACREAQRFCCAVLKKVPCIFSRQKSAHWIISWWNTHCYKTTRTTTMKYIALSICSEKNPLHVLSTKIRNTYSPGKILTTTKPQERQQWKTFIVYIVYSLVVSTISADDLAQIGARASAGTVVNKCRSHIYA